MASQLALQAHEVSKTYGERRALDGVSFSVEPGEMVALIGASGSGKSTLLRSLTGLVCIDAGVGRISVLEATVQSDGRVANKVRQVRMRVGFISQQFGLVPRLSLFSNAVIGSLGRVGFWKGLFALWPVEETSRAMAALARVGVAELAGERASSLSGGQQQRGAIARSLVQGAEILLADEPVASLDPVSARRVMDILHDLNRRDAMTVIVTLHQVEHAIRYCPRVVALRAGRIVYDGPSQALDRARLIDIYGPEFDDVLFEPHFVEGPKS